jgi:predicted dehydrogenase
MNVLSRRRFLAVAASRAGFVAIAPLAPMAPARARAAGANNRVHLALVGAGGRGTGLAAQLAKLDDVAFKYVCDPYAPNAARVARSLGELAAPAPRAVADLRRVLEDAELDAVVIATPEQWHSVATLWACRAGKDVYVEKNVALTIAEGRLMIEAARRHRRIVQVGFQNRSAPYARSARDYLASGKLGRIVHVKVYNLLPDTGPWQERQAASPPADLDWDLWLGPAPAVAYTPSRQTGWTNYWDYSGGVLSGDASHQLDLARLAMGDPPHPRGVHATGGRLAYDDRREVPDLQVITYEYGGFVMTCESGTFTPYMKKFTNEVRYGTQWPDWRQSATRIEIYGTRQMMYLGRHGCGWQVFEGDGKVVAEDKGYFPDKWHLPDFVDAVRSRQVPRGDVEQAHHSACLVHLGNLAYRLGNRRLAFDGAGEQFVGCPEADALAQPRQRAGYAP